MTSPRSGLQGRSWLGKLVPTLSARELLLLWPAVFCTFAAIGFLIDIVIGGRFPTAWLALTVLVSGVLAVGFTFTSLRRQWFAMTSLVVADIVYTAAWAKAALAAVADRSPLAADRPRGPSIHFVHFRLR